jgi:predicted dehydrogenase|tara:strand:+ start:439 stop:1443 length:1005 start_codon:yes stop_codon:yes gene_type:complete
MKIAIIEASHWHVPLYLDELESDPSVGVVAVSDETATRGPGIATRFGATHYGDWRNLVDTETLDFAFVFGRHDQMYDIAVTLIGKGIPFAIEKPAGLSGVQVAALAELASRKNIFVAVPLIFGFSTLIQKLSSVAKSAEWQHMSFRFIAGPISRYLDAHCDWMLDRSKAGGGCMTNLAVHCIDVFQRLTGSPVQSVSARMIRDHSLSDVEIYSVMTMHTENGQLCTIETGYTYPGGTQEQREFSFSLGSSSGYVQSTIDGLRIVSHASGKADEIKLDLNTDIYYADFVRRCLQDVQEQRSPASGLPELTEIMRIIDVAYDSDRTGGEAKEIARP